MTIRILRWLRKFRETWSSTEGEGDLEEELRFHVEMETESYVAAGMDKWEARRKALSLLGGRNRILEECRSERSWAWLGDLLSDARYGLRLFRRRKEFSVSVVLTLGLCLGVNLSFYSALESLVFEPLPFPDSEKLVEIYRRDLVNGGSKLGSNLSLLSEYDGKAELFENVAYLNGKWANIEISGRSFRGNAIYVSDSFFKVLGIEPLAGEDPGDGASDGSVWLSQTVWEADYSSDEGLLGQPIRIDGKVMRIAGIAPVAAGQVSDWASVFVKLDRVEQVADFRNEVTRATSEGAVWARLAEGVSVELAKSELVASEVRFLDTASAEYREVNGQHLRQIEVKPVHDVRSSWARSRLLLLNAGAALLLVIGCVNVANLMFAQANARGEEYWARRVLGAARFRLVRQCVCEAWLLVCAGWLVGGILSLSGIKFLESYSGELFQRQASIVFGWGSFLYVVGLALLCSLALGTFVGWRALAASRRVESSRSAVQSTPSRASNTIQKGLAVWQTAFTLALLICGGLLMKSFYLVTSQDFGFDEEGLVTARVHLSHPAYEDASVKEAFKRGLVRGLENHADVEGVALASTLPTFGYPDQLVIKHEAAEGEARRRSYFSYVSPEYMDTLGIALLEGRGFVESDEFGWQTPIVVDERFAELVFPGESVVGKRVQLGWKPRNPNNWPVIVGVVERVRDTAVDSDDGLPLAYLPLKGSWVDEFSVFVKSRRESGFSLQLIRDAVQGLDPGMPLFRSGSMESLIAESLAGRRGLLGLCVALGAAALLLSCVGVYGASAFRVSQRVRELAIRLAMGATESRVVRSQVLADMRIALVGFALGVFLALHASRFLASWLFEVEPVDEQIYLGLTVALLLVYALSSYLPSRRGVKGARLRL